MSAYSGTPDAAPGREAAAPESEALAAAVAHVRSGGLVAFPTETVWGIGADARSEAAVMALRHFKGRGEASPVAILVESAAALRTLGLEVGEAAARLSERFWPGPLTLVLPCRTSFAAGVARGDGAVGVRCSPHPAARGLAAALAHAGVGPITATSLNRSGDPPARTRDEAQRVCDAPGGPLLLSPAPDAGGEVPSTVLDLSGARPVVLRWGAVSEAALAPVLEEIRAA